MNGGGHVWLLWCLPGCLAVIPAVYWSASRGYPQPSALERALALAVKAFALSLVLTVGLGVLLLVLVPAWDAIL